MPFETLDALQVEVADLIRAASGVNAMIQADQGQAPPSELYGTYKIHPIRAYGQPRDTRALTPAEEPGPTDDWEDLAITTISQMELMVSVNFIQPVASDATGYGARDAAWRLHNSNFRATISERLYNAGLGWRYASDVRDLTGLDRAGIQQRHQVDVYLVAEMSITDTVLRAAGASVSITDDFGNILYED